MRELPYEIKQFFECVTVYCHRGVHRVENYAVLIIINIRRILEAPVPAVYFDRYNAVVLARWEIHSSCVALALTAEHTFRISRLRRVFGGGDSLRVLFGL